MEGTLSKSISFRKSVAHLEMDDTAKRVRKTLMDIAPSVGVSKNDLFNRGYGSFVAIVIALGFGVTFLYYAIANSVYNKTAKFLVPANGGEIKGAMHCSHVAVTLSDSYAMDSNGLWNSNTEFSLGESLYGLELVNAQYKSQHAYENEMKAFADDLYEKSSAAEENDYAWNIVFGGSYAVDSSAGSNGIATFFVNADSRLMYDVGIYTSGISNINGTCVPVSSSVSYDGTNFKFVTSLSLENDSFCSQLSPTSNLATSLGLYDNFQTTGEDVVSATLKFDAATITTAIAINYQIAPLSTLTPVPSLDVYPYLTAYIDSSYAPMQPVYCFDPSEVGSYPQFEALCLVKLGEVYAYPVTAHYGQYNGDDDDSTSTFLPDMCDCTNIDNQPDCQEYDIEIGLIFNPDESIYDILVSILVMQELAFLYDMSIQTYVRPMLASSIESSYYVFPGEPLTWPAAKESLQTSFESICPSCYMLSFELYDNEHYGIGATINKGAKVLNNLACTNVFYDSDVLDTMISTPPSDITEPYLVCTDSLGTAVSTGISNAYASAGLYTSVLAFLLMVLIHQYQSRIKATPINSTEVQEVLVRNAIADLFEYILNKDCPDEDREYIAEKLEIIGITDPLTHAERPNTFGHIGALIAANRSGKMPAPGDRPETVYHGRLVDDETPSVEMVSPSPPPEV